MLSSRAAGKVASLGLPGLVASGSASKDQAVVGHSEDHPERLAASLRATPRCLSCSGLPLASRAMGKVAGTTGTLPCGCSVCPLPASTPIQS